MLIIFEGTGVRSLHRTHIRDTSAAPRIFPVIFDRYLPEMNTMKSPRARPERAAKRPSQMVPSRRTAKQPAPRAVARIVRALGAGEPFLISSSFSSTSDSV